MSQRDPGVFLSREGHAVARPLADALARGWSAPHPVTFAPDPLQNAEVRRMLAALARPAPASGSDPYGIAERAARRGLP